MRSFITCNLHPNIINAIKSGRTKRANYLACLGKREMYATYGRKLTGKPERRRGDNIEMRLKDIRWINMKSVHLVWHRYQL
jgi:hypothetical protein